MHFCATHSVSFLVLPFAQLKRKKMAARYFFNGDQLAKVVQPETCFLGPVKYDRTFLGPVQYDRSFHGKHSKLLNMGKMQYFQQCKVNGTISWVYNKTYYYRYTSHKCRLIHLFIFFFIISLSKIA